MRDVDELAARLAEPSPKVDRFGSWRSVCPEETLERVRPIAVAAGVTRVGGIGGLDRLGFPVYCAFRPLSRNLAVSQGKGLTEAAAKVSALMEAVELWHAERHARPVRYATYRELAAEGASVVEVDRLVRCPCSEYAPDRTLRWIRGLELMSGGPMWVPYESVHCDWRTPIAAGDHSFQNGSNGLASGNTYAEAVVHALCELVERDTIVRFDGLPEAESLARRVDPVTLTDTACRDALGRFAAAGVEVVIWDMTSTLGLPTYSCVAVERDVVWYQPLPQTQGSGAHPARGTALLRALTETAQARAAVIAGSRDDIFDDRYRHYFDGRIRREIAEEAGIAPVRPFDSTVDVAGETTNDDLEWLLGQLRLSGFEQVVVVDLADPRRDLPVVKVVAPGLQWRPWED